MWGPEFNIAVDVEWVKCNNRQSWCPFMQVDLTNVRVEGVYVIWAVNLLGTSRTVRIGQGDIQDRLQAHRTDAVILRRIGADASYVTWAAVADAERNGVERYLANHLAPPAGDVFPDANPIRVNLPR